jgi:hypothetical protein
MRNKEAWKKLPWKKLPWLNKSIEAIYRQRDIITKQTGIAHEVDHIHPVKHSKLCGLTVPWNLQIIPASENRSKSNKIDI